MMLKPAHCNTCIGNSWSGGFVPASGSGENGVLIVAEAAGETEAGEGIPLIGKAGQFLWQNLQRVGIEREGFRVHSLLSCRPPDNKLAGMPYEDAAISHCSPLLDETITDMQVRCAQGGRHLVIVTLGKVAFKRILGLSPKDPILKEDYLVYPHWSEKYQAWVLAVDHPSFLMRGKTNLVPVLQYTFQRALEIAEGGLELEQSNYMLDPRPETFGQWVKDYCDALRNDPNLILSYDIETPYKAGKSEEELAKEEGDDYTILRVSFCYRPGEAVSVPWNAQYRPYLEQIFDSGGQLLTWNGNLYDDPRVGFNLGRAVTSIDGMVAWHILNSALPKGLGFVTPFYVKNTSMWKHLSEAQPAFYNAKDADMALRNYIGIERDLKANDLWRVFDRHVIYLDKALNYMTSKGVLRDEKLRQEAEVQFGTILDNVEAKMEASVPLDARRIKIYKSKPKKENVECYQLTKEFPVDYCSSCGLQKPKRWKKHMTLCSGQDVVSIQEPKEVWAMPLAFKVSKLGLSNYQKALKHQAVVNRKENKVTFDEAAIMKLMKQYPNDPLYPLILEHRSYQKLLGTYVGVTDLNGSIRGGMPVGADGRIHCVYSHNPSTLRLASQNPNMQNLPRVGKPDDPATIIRNLIVAAPGSTFEATDYAGIEAVLVGYFAMAPAYIRLAKHDIHSFYTAYALNQLDGRVAANDLPLLSWDDDKLFARLADLKKEFKHERNTLYKHLVHAINFGQGAKGAQAKIHLETGIMFPLKDITMVMGVYKELFPEISRWHWNTLLQVEKDGFLRNPFGYCHRFTRPFDYEKIGGKWQKSQGSDANAIWAFGPQSTAAGIMKEAIIRLFYDRFDEAGQFLRLTVHDELLSEVPESLLDIELRVKQEEMGRPVRELPLPASYGMGEYLSIGVESKVGTRWAAMKGV